MFLALSALALTMGSAPLTAAELPCASAESMHGLMAAWTAGFNAGHQSAPARVVKRARYSADFVDALGRGEVRVAPFARELFASERSRLAGLAGGAPILVPVAIGSRATKGGTHAIVFFVNARNPLGRISLAQLREVWARDGRLTTWGQLGLAGEWANRRITLHGMRVRRATGNPPGIVNFLEARLLRGRAWRDDVREYSDPPGGTQALAQIVQAVAADEAAIGYSGFAYAAPGAKAVALAETEAGPFFAGTAAEIACGEYPLARRIYLCLRPGPDPTASELVRFALSQEGQRLIAADGQGFFPLPEAEIIRALALLPPPSAAAVDPSLPAFVPQPMEVPRGASYVTPDGAIAIVGYNDMQGLLTALNARFVAAHPGFRFSLTLKGTRTAPPALARGESAFAPMGADFSTAELARYRALTGREPLRFRIAHCSLSPRALSGPLAIVVHHDNPLASLTLAQVRRVFAGDIASWSELGLGGPWSRRAMHPCGLGAELALGMFLRDRVALGSAFGPGFSGFAQSAEVIKQVGQDPLAIGFAAINRVTPEVKVLAIAPTDRDAPIAPTDQMVRTGQYPLDRYLLVYARQPLDPFVREYLRLVFSREGQEAIAGDTLGYLPLNVAEAAAERAKL